MHYYLLLTGLVFIVGLIPAFGPPSWMFAVYFYHSYHLSFPLVVLVTALSTTIGRLILAVITKKIKRFLPAKSIKNLDYGKSLLLKRQKSIWLFLGLFVLSPLPSAQLFEAAGLIETKLLYLGGAFFIGRLVSLSFYLILSKFVVQNIASLWSGGLTNPWMLAAEIISILLIIILLNLRWFIRIFRKKI